MSFEIGDLVEYVGDEEARKKHDEDYPTMTWDIPEKKMWGIIIAIEECVNSTGIGMLTIRYNVPDLRGYLMRERYSYYPFELRKICDS